MIEENQMTKPDYGMKEFRKSLIDAANSNCQQFAYCGKNYLVVTYEEYVQTLIDNRILYRIYLDDSKNTEDLLKDYNFN